MKKLVLEVPELLIIQLKRFRKVENPVKKIYKRVKFPMMAKSMNSKELDTIQEAQYQVITQQQRSSKKIGGIVMM